MSELRSCPECRRHVKFEKDDHCPFCNAKTSALRAAAVVAAAAVSVMAAAACGDKPVAHAPDGTPSAVPSASAAPSAVPSVKRGDQAPAPVYGGPPP